VKATLLRCLLAGLLSLVLAGGAAAQAPVGPLPEPLATTPSPEPELERGKATWYGPKFHGRRTSSGERFDMNELTAAHETLPFGTRVRVRNVANGREVVVRINDRTHRVGDRIIDLSKAAAAALGFLKAGAAQVVLIGP
jgi:rare lipoprotein A